MRMRMLVAVGFILTAACGGSASDAGGTLQKVADVPGEPQVPLHLYVTEQTSDTTVDLHVWINGTLVMTGDLDTDAPPGTISTLPKNFVEFEIRVPEGALELHVEAFGGQVTLDETIEVPSERWGHLTVTFRPDADDVPRLEWNLADMFLPFACHRVLGSPAAG